MLQLQYLNTKLKKNHIEQILSNYNIKYITMKNEIESKINTMIKTFNQDISSFLSNLEEIAEQKQKLKSLEHSQEELESVREQLKNKIHELTKVKREIELLKNENNRLKTDINNNYNRNSSIKKNRVFSPSYRNNNNNYSLNSATYNRTQKKLKETKSFLLKTEHKDNKENLFKSPSNLLKSKTRKKISDLDLDDKIKNIKIKYKTNKNKLSSSLNTEVKTEPNVIKNVKKYSKNSIKKKNNKIFVIKKKDINKNDNLIKNKPKIKIKEMNLKFNSSSNNTFMNTTKEKLSKTTNNSKNKKNDKEAKKINDNSYTKDSALSSSDNESIANLDYTDEEKKYIDDEINEMNDFEEEILSLMEQIKEFKAQNNNLT